MELEVIKMARVMTGEQATELVGTPVPNKKPNLTKACVVVDEETGEPVMAYLPLDRDIVKQIRHAVLSIKSWGTAGRAGGWDSASRTFGMAPRKPFHGRESCRPTSMATEEPETHAVFVNLAEHLDKMLKEIAPEIWEADVEVMDRVADEWKMLDGSTWTSGVVNRSAALPYHRDGFNFEVWSGMPVIRRGMRGGYLDVPEYEMVVECKDGWVLFFPGYLVVHGVTPLEPVDKDGYRFSVVYYSLKGMKDCFTYAVETAMGRKKRTEREQDLADAVSGKKDFKIGKNNGK